MPANNSKTQFKRSPSDDGKHVISLNESEDDRPRERSFTILRHHSMETSSSMRGSMRINSTFDDFDTTLFIYNSEELQEITLQGLQQIASLNSNKNIWLNVQTRNERLLRSIEKRFNIHPLVISDVECDEQRTKIDVLDDAFFIALKLIYRDTVHNQIFVEQISFYMIENVLITFEKHPHRIFDSIKNRIRSNKRRIRQSKIDYLAYLLLDEIVDQYIDVLNIARTKVESIEDQLMGHPSHDTLETIYELKRQMLDYRRCISPLKEVIIKLQKEESHIIREGTIIYFKDLFDHVVQVNDEIDTIRETLSSFIDFYMMMNANAMGEVMKTLTIISTIFIPLTFIAGLYGMNFENMPELRWKYSYFVVLTIMIVLVLFMLACFRRKRWL